MIRFQRNIICQYIEVFEWQYRCNEILDKCQFDKCDEKRNFGLTSNQNLFYAICLLNILSCDVSRDIYDQMDTPLHEYKGTESFPMARCLRRPAVEGLPTVAKA